MQQVSRRSFTQNLLGSLLSFSLVKTLYQADVLPNTFRPTLHLWLRELEHLSSDLKAGNLKQSDWQMKVAELFDKVELPGLLRTINFDRLARKIKLSDEREAVLGIELPQLEGVPTDLTYSTLFEALRKGRAIAPHGHRNMASMHLILRGQAHLRQYDRLADEPNHLVVSQSVDKLCGAGELSSISDEKNNIHWFKGISDVTYIFNASIYRVNPAEGSVGREYLDPNRGERIKDGVMRVRRLRQNEAFRLYNRA